ELPEDLKTDMVRIVVSLVIFAVSWALHIPLLFIASYIICGYDVIWKALKNIVKGKVFDENFLMALATVGALVLSSYSEAAAVMIFYQVGEYFQTKAVIRSRKSIKSLLDISAKEARLEDGTMVSAEDVNVGDIIEVRPGEKISLDGEVASGASSLDTKALTGESIPSDVLEGSQVLSGSVNLSSVLKIKVTKPYDESTAKKMIDLIENGSEKRSRSEQFITRFSGWYTPLVCILALIVAFAVPFITGGSYSEWIYRAMELLVVSCPCALVLSIPLSYFASIGAFARNGLLVKGSDSVERLSKAGRICFDKTGTLTKGELKVTRAVNLTDVNILPILAALESSSNHPMAKAIMEYAGSSVLKADFITEKPGYGVEGTVEGKEYQAGAARFFSDAPKLDESAVYLGQNGKVIGYVTLSDTVRESAAGAVSELRKLGVNDIVMISGDRDAVCRRVSEELKLDSYRSELLPEGKLEELKKLCSDNLVTAYCGDGINDAPALAAADVGISMGGVGSDAAIEQSDLVIISDDPSRIADGIRISRKTETIVKENITFSLVIKAAVIILSVLGLSSMWLAIF
ncbi:MAG: heavy metal translocating P-type ATPase, partial [Bullifex sp.]